MLFQFDPVTNTTSFSHPLRWNEETMKRVGGEEEVTFDQHRFTSSIFPHQDGSVTVILDRIKLGQALWSSADGIYFPYVVLHLDADEQLVSSTILERREKLLKNEILSFESGYSWCTMGDTLWALTRERKEVGAVIYKVDLGTGTVESKAVAEFGRSAYLGAGYTLWHAPGIPTIFIRNGRKGREWYIMRITP